MVETLTLVLDHFASSVVCAYLFGSHARGEAGPQSDIDVAVLLDGVSTGALIGPLTRIRGELERAVGCEVDVVDMAAVSPDLIHRILRDGVLVADNDPEARARFEVAARNAYFDVLPYLREYRSGVAS